MWIGVDGVALTGILLCTDLGTTLGNCYSGHVGGMCQGGGFALASVEEVSSLRDVGDALYDMRYAVLGCRGGGRHGCEQVLRTVPAH